MRNQDCYKSLCNSFSRRNIRDLHDGSQTDRHRNQNPYSEYPYDISSTNDVNCYHHSQYHPYVERGSREGQSLISPRNLDGNYDTSYGHQNADTQSSLAAGQVSESNLGHMNVSRNHHLKTGNLRQSHQLNTSFESANSVFSRQLRVQDHGVNVESPPSSALSGPHTVNYSRRFEYGDTSYDQKRSANFEAASEGSSSVNHRSHRHPSCEESYTSLKAGAAKRQKLVWDANPRDLVALGVEKQKNEGREDTSYTVLSISNNRNAVRSGRWSEQELLLAIKLTQCLIKGTLRTQKRMYLREVLRAEINSSAIRVFKRFKGHAVLKFLTYVEGMEINSEDQKELRVAKLPFSESLIVAALHTPLEDIRSAYEKVLSEDIGI